MNSLILLKNKKKLISFKKSDISICKIKNDENIEEKNKKNQIIDINSSKKLNDIKIFNYKNSETYSLNKKKKEIEINEINSARDNSRDKSKNKSDYLFNIKKRYKTEIIIDNKDSLKAENPKYKDILNLICNYISDKKRKTILLNKRLNIFIEKLDIFNIFKNMCLIEKIAKNLKYDLDAIKLPDLANR